MSCKINSLPCPALPRGFKFSDPDPDDIDSAIWFTQQMMAAKPALDPLPLLKSRLSRLQEMKKELDSDRAAFVEREGGSAPSGARESIVSNA